MSDFLDSQRGWMPPLADDKAPPQYKPQTLAGTGTTESSNQAPLTNGRMHILTVGSAPVRILFSGTGNQADVVPPSGGFVLPANYVFPFKAFRAKDGSYGSVFVYVEAADGTSDYEVSVLQRT